MIRAWWDAHAFEFCLSGAVVVALSAVWCVGSIRAAWRRRRRPNLADLGITYGGSSDPTELE